MPKHPPLREPVICMFPVHSIPKLSLDAEVHGIGGGCTGSRAHCQKPGSLYFNRGVLLAIAPLL
jgi:hypothetical protein